MRIAILADIHGNLPAFEAVLRHVRQQGVDQVIIAGDLVNGAPDSIECWQLAQTVPCVLLRGNHERYVFDFGLPHAPAVWQTERFAPVHWTVAQFSTAERRQLSELPFAVRPPAAPDLLIVHASLRRDNDLIAAYTPEAELAAMFPDSPENYIVRGHEHWCQMRLWGERTIITTGSVGWTLDENQATAQYLDLRAAGQSLVDSASSRCLRYTFDRATFSHHWLSPSNWPDGTPDAARDCNGFFTDRAFFARL